MIMRLVAWNGRAIAARARRAAAIGIDQTTAAATLRASERAPRDTGFMANTMEWWPARMLNGRMTGMWGNVRADYTLWVEIGAQGRPGRYFMRMAADEQYPLLQGRVAAAYKRGGR